MDDRNRECAEKMGLLVGLLRRNLNGAAVDSMEELGIHYSRNWGVSLPAIRKAAGAFAPDHNFARFLYTQELRELRLAAFIIADPLAVTADELPFWGAGVENSELAENLAFSLLSHTSLSRTLAVEWLRDDAPALLQYCALLAVARMLDKGVCDLSKEEMKELAERCAESGSSFTAKAAAALSAKLSEP